VEVVPTIPFNVLGQKITDASAVRKMYLNGNDAERFQIITDLYGAPDPELKELFDLRLGANTPEEIVQYGTPIIDGGLADPAMRESREQRIRRLAERITKLKQLITEHRSTSTNLDYLDEKISR
jgi:hypothetical protein